MRTLGRNWKLPQSTKYYLFPEQAKTYYQNADFLSQFETAYETVMDNIYYLGPLRSFPKRSYQWSGTSPTDVIDTNVVVDTNVLIVANGKSEQASIDCELSCLDLLEHPPSLAVVLDETSLIMNEYERHCSYQGAPGVGDMFFKYLHDNQYNPDNNIELVEIRPIDNESRSFEQLPPNNFDPSDRKLLATAVVANASVVNATDSDWQEQQELMQQLNVTVHQLCPDCCSRN